MESAVATTNYGGTQASEGLRIGRAHADFCPCGGVWALCCDNADNYVDAGDGIGAVATYVSVRVMTSARCLKGSGKGKKAMQSRNAGSRR